jgi:hypothetical protein
MIEAKRFAQIDPTVSRTTQIVWIPPIGEPMLFQDDGVTTLKKLIEKYGLRPTDELDSDDIRKRFEDELRKTALPYNT